MEKQLIFAKEVSPMATELEIRRSDKLCLYQMLREQHESKAPEEFKGLIAWQKAHMEPEDVKLVLHEFEEWKNS
jgi:hypothetical protein